MRILPSYIFYTATGEDFEASKINRKTGFVGESAQYDVYLFYEPRLDYLKNTALTLDVARGLPKGSGKKRLVFAPTKYLDSIHLDEHRIEFCQLPFEIYKAVEAQTMKLKEYQERALGEVKRFLEQLIVWRGKARQDDGWLFDFAENGLGKGEEWPNVPQEEGRAWAAPPGILPQDSDGRRQDAFGGKDHRSRAKHLPPAADRSGGVDCAHPSDLPADLAALEGSRRSLPAAPGHGFSGQDADSGKGGRLYAAGCGRASCRTDVDAALRVACQQDALRMFKDSGAFQAFFPPEDDKDGHAKLLERVPNLDTFEGRTPFGEARSKHRWETRFGSLSR